MKIVYEYFIIPFVHIAIIYKTYLIKLLDIILILEKKNIIILGNDKLLSNNSEFVTQYTLVVFMKNE